MTRTAERDDCLAPRTRWPRAGDGAVRDALDPAVKTARTRRPAPTAEELTELLEQHQGNVAARGART